MAFHTPLTFSEEIETLAASNDLSLLETLTWHCERNGIEVETITKLITPDLKKKIAVQATAVNLMRREGKPLPI